MKVKELMALLKNVNPEADIIVDVDGGSIYPIKVEETEEYNNPDELATCVEYGLVAGEW